MGLLFCPFLRAGLFGKNRGFPIKDVGNDRGGIEDAGHDRRGIENGGHDGGAIEDGGHDGGGNRGCPLTPLSFPPVFPLSFPQGFSGNPWVCSSVLSFGRACLGKTMDSRLKMSGMTEGAIDNVEHDTGRNNGRAIGGRASVEDRESG